MLSASAVVGVSIGVAEAQDALPKPMATGDAGPAVGEGEWHMQHADPDAGMNTGNMGYGVVDPMPPPSRRGCGCHKDDPYE
jgi:hypothetical protein